MPIPLSIFLWLLGVAQTAPVPAVKQEIVVTAARDEQPRDQASAAVTVLDRHAIDALPASSLSEVLGFVPGVTMMFDSGASGLPMITSRGFFGGGEVEYVKLIVDGVPAGDAESGNVDWQRFRAADIDRIEILHGPGSALYGDTALGGVIQVFTTAERHDSDGDVHLGGGSFGGREEAATYWLHFASGYRLNAAGSDWATNGFRQSADANERHGHLTLEHLGDRSRWRVDGEAGREHRQQPGPLTQAEIDADREQSNALFRFDGENTSRSRVAASFDSWGRAPLHATIYGVRRGDDNLRTLLLAPGFGTSAFRALTTNVGGGTFEASRESAVGIIRAGADLERAKLSGSYASVSRNGTVGGTVAGADGSRNRVGLFVTAARSFGQRYFLTAGLRRDDIRDDFTSNATAGLRHNGSSSAWSPRAGLNVHLGPAQSPTSLFVQWSRAFKAPTLDQLFDPRPYPNGTGGTFTISNPDLHPQRARNLEAGVSRVTAWSDWSLVAYRMNVGDEIDFDPQTFTYKNIGTSLHRGVEASFAMAKGARISPRLTYAWTHVADSETPNVQLKNIPEQTAQLALHWRVAAGTSSDLVYRWRDSIGLDDAGAFRSPSVSRVDLRVAHDVRSVRVQADLLNALNAQYNELGYVLRDFRGRAAPLQFPAPGRSWRLGLTWTFAPKGSLHDE